MRQYGVKTRLIQALLVGLVSVVVGCDSLNRDEKFRYSISHTVEQPPAIVVSLVRDTVRALRLAVVSSSTTNIDGQFWVKSALGDEFKILVIGVRTDTTTIDIYMPSRKNLDQAKLILTEIRSRLKLSGST